MNLPKSSIVTAALFCCFASVSSTSAEDKINFEDHVKPIFRAKCASCHNTNKKTADLDLSNYTAMMQGGGSGASIEPGDPDSSYLFMLINHDSEPYMPPNSDKLPDAMVETVRKWIELGAPETSSSKVMLPKKAAVNLSVDVSGDRPAGPPPMPDVLGLEPVVHTPTTTAVSAIATSPWAKLVAVAGQKQVVLYNSQTLQPLAILPFPEGQPRVLKFSRSGALLLAGGGHGASKGLAVVWDIKSGERIMQVGDELDEVLAADISADQSLVALGGPGKIVRVYSTVSGELAYEITKHTDWIYSLEFSPDSVLLATSDRAGGLHVWEAFTGRQYLTLNGHKGAVNSVSWRLDSNVLASASADASVKLWEMENGKSIKSWTAHGGGTTSMEFCRDGRVVTCGRDKVAKIWDQAGKQLKAFEKFSDLALRVSHCDETDQVIAGDWTGEVRVWKAADGVRVGNLTTNPPTLQARLKQAEESVVVLNKKLADAQAALKTATAAQAAYQKKVSDSKATLGNTQKLLTQNQSDVKAKSALLAAAKIKQAGVQNRATKLAAAIPELTAAAKTAAEAAGMMSEDASLKTVVAKLNEQVMQKQAELQKAQQEVKTIGAEVATLTKTVAATTTQIAAGKKAVPVQKASYDKLVAGTKAVDDKVANATGVLNGAQAEVNQATGDVEKWKQYVALQNELQLLAAKLAEKDKAHLAFLEADAVVKEAQQTMAATEQQIAASSQTIAASQKSVADMNAAIAAAEKQKASSKVLADSHAKAIPVLKTAIDQAKAASSMLPNDEDIKTSVSALEKTSAAKQQKLTELQQQMVAADKTMADSKAGIARATTAMETAKKEMTAAQQTLTKLAAEAAPMQKVAEEKKVQLAAVENEVTKAQAVVEARKQQLRPRIQVTQVAR